MLEVLYQNLISGRLQEALGGPGRLQEGLLEAAGGFGRPWGAPEEFPGSGRPRETPGESPGEGTGLQCKKHRF